MKKKIIGIFICFLFIGTSFVSSVNTEDKTSLSNITNNGWWNNDWIYRKELGISDASSDYQMLIQVWKEDGHDDVIQGIIDCEDNCNEDFSDIRFIDNVQTTQLSYWIEEKGSISGEHYAQIWVKTSGEESIYMYYGNPDAYSESEGDETFIFFDDFLTFDTSIWDEYDPDDKVTISVEDGILNIAFGSDIITGVSGGVATNVTVATDALVVAKRKGEKGSDGFNQPITFGLTDNDGYFIKNCYRDIGDVKKYFLNILDETTYQQMIYSSDTYPSLEWRTLYLKKLQNWNAGGAFTNYYNGNRVGVEKIGNYILNSPFHIYINGRTFDDGLNSYCDWIFVAKYDFIEPMWGSFGEQEVLYALEIVEITGGLFKVKAVIKNIGFAEITDVYWNMSLDGGLILLGKYTTGIIDSITLEEEVVVKSNFIFGLGQTIITVNTEMLPTAFDTKDQAVQILLFFIKI